MDCRVVVVATHADRRRVELPNDTERLQQLYEYATCLCVLFFGLVLHPVRPRSLCMQVFSDRLLAFGFCNKPAVVGQCGVCRAYDASSGRGDPGGVVSVEFMRPAMSIVGPRQFGLGVPHLPTQNCSCMHDSCAPRLVRVASS